jgi:hypothetical protein
MPRERIGVVLRVLVAWLPDKGLGVVIAAAIIAIASVITAIASVIIEIAVAIIVIAGGITPRQGVVVAADRASQADAKLRGTHACARIGPVHCRF